MSDVEDKVARQLSLGAVYGNTFKTIDPWASSTGFCTHAFHHRNLSYTRQHRIAEEFLINTRLKPQDRETEMSIEAYFQDLGVVTLSLGGQTDVEGLGLVSLPESPPLQMEIGQVIQQRRSCRAFTGEPIELDHLAAILRAAAGITGRADVNLMAGGQASIYFRAVPSGGGTYPIDLYFAAFDVNDLDIGIYRYSPIDDHLIQMGDYQAAEALRKSFSIPEEIISLSRACVAFLMVGRPWKSMKKYGPRGVRLMLMETGAIAEHINLASVALGYGSVDCSGIYDDQAHLALELDGVYSMLLHSVVLGHPG